STRYVVQTSLWFAPQLNTTHHLGQGSKYSRTFHSSEMLPRAHMSSKTETQMIFSRPCYLEVIGFRVMAFVSISGGITDKGPFTRWNHHAFPHVDIYVGYSGKPLQGSIDAEYFSLVGDDQLSAWSRN